MEKFLEFWSHYNAAIIETLVALILISAIYLAYRTFFGAKGGDVLDGVSGSAGSGAVNTVQIEKTLQKILDQQQTAVRSASASFEGGADSAAAKEVSAALQQEISQLRMTLAEKESEIVLLEAKATQSSAAAPSAQDIAAAASAAAGLAEKERLDYQVKIKELEARLAEYEIISEDIADLSFFKEENQRLTKELEALRGAAGTPPGVVPTPVAAAPIAEPEPPAPAAPEEAAGGIDDSLMAEFAAAVEGQKSGTLETPPSENENEKLLAEFENFNKKS